MLEPLESPNSKAKITRPGGVCPNGSQISNTEKAVRIIARMAILYRPYISAKYPGRQRPNTDPTFNTGSTADETEDEKPIDLE